MGTVNNESISNHLPQELATYYGVHVENAVLWKLKRRVLVVGKGCITENDEIRTVCLNREVLKTKLFMLSNMRGDEINIQNSYRQYTWWIHNCLGRGVRKIIPSYAIWAIRDLYPEAGQNMYIPFHETRHEIEI